jgi:hypothetical protein
MHVLNRSLPSSSLPSPLFLPSSSSFAPSSFLPPSFSLPSSSLPSLFLLSSFSLPSLFLLSSFSLPSPLPSLAYGLMQKGRSILQLGSFSKMLLQIFPGIGLDEKGFEKERRRRIQETMQKKLKRKPALVQK